MAGERVKGESHLAYEYFEIYRGMPPNERSLDRLCRYEVGGRKRTQKVFDRWSSNYDWQDRINKWDINRSRDALRAFIIRRNDDLEQFIDNDFTIMKSGQQIVVKKTLKMSKEKDPNATEFRTIMLGYQVVREALKDMIGIFDKDAENASKQPES